MRSTIAAAAGWLLVGLVAGCGDAPASGATADPKVPARAEKTATAEKTAESPSPSAADTPEPTARITVAGGKVTSGPREVTAKLGDRVVLEVVADAADELHVHGYDVAAKVRAGKPARVSFDATIPGVFEVELHSGVVLCELRVS